jgi:hypothetical protein
MLGPKLIIPQLKLVVTLLEIVISHLELAIVMERRREILLTEGNAGCFILPKL